MIRGGEKKVKNRWFLVVVVICVFMMSTNIMAKDTLEPMITIGLKSVYKDVDTIVLSSEEYFKFGEMRKEGLIEYGVLGSNKMKIKKGNGTYYTDGVVYKTFKEASLAKGKNEWVCYIRPNVYKIYNKNNVGVVVPSNSNRLAIYNMYNADLMMLSENKENPIYFQGRHSNYVFPTTKVKSNIYRGGISAVVRNGALTAVNKLPMEEYLYGVIPYEMPTSWGIEALKAQAVCARSYANINHEKYGSQGYNLNDTTESQVYRGVDGEVDKARQAVNETRNQVVWYKGQIANTYYSSTNGGYIESALDAWGGGDYGYLKSKEDPYEIKPEMEPWTRIIKINEIENCLKARGKDLGKLISVEIVKKSEAHRVLELKFTGEKGDYSVYRYDTCSIWANSSNGTLPSNYYKLYTKLNKDTGDILWVTLQGRGFGHGVGLSQSGARGMADLGYNYKQIIKFYFEGALVY